jgi:hypothetical protein
MKTNDHHVTPGAIAPHRYQIYRQSKNGVYQRYGAPVESLETAVELFLDTRPDFEGGGVRLWDRNEQRALASTEWLVENTTFGFPVRVRADAFYDENVGRLAREICAREALIESLGQRVDMMN